jgi:uncharacterized membrane protein YdjX (TVP38/TMEM64 family)
MLIFFLATFGIMEAMHISFLQDPTTWLHQWDGWVSASVGVVLLIADVFLPVPSSLVMIAHGALFGVPLGTVLSLLGTVGATSLGFMLGRRGGPLLVRLVRPEEKARADGLLNKWGAIAILITRPIPLFAETVAILAGTSPMGWGKMLMAAICGSLPASLLYALTGATARGFSNGILMFGLVMIISGVFWWVGKKIASGADHGIEHS